MREKKSPYQQFDKKVEEKYDLLVNECSVKVDKAREGSKLKQINGFFIFANEQFQLTLKELGKNSRFFIEIRDELDDDKEKEFAFVFNQKFTAASNVDKTVLLNNLSQLMALDKLFVYLSQERIKYQPAPFAKAENLSTTIKWKGTTELEFVQLIYALNEAGYLENEESEITTLVRQVAKVFNFSLGDHWQSNLSKSVNIRKTGYKPEIFQKLERAFEIYREKKITKSK